MKILYLYSELMPYNIPVLEYYLSKYNADISVVSWDKKKVSPYVLNKIDNINFYNRSTFNLSKLISFINNFNPDIIYISGWMDKIYLFSILPYRIKGGKVVTGSDAIWTGSIKQHLISFIIKFLKKLFFTNIWIPGPEHFEFAKKLGFKNNEIIFNCYSANTPLFNNAFNLDKFADRISSKRRFIFVGRLEKVKGIENLLETWNNLSIYHNKWELIIIGSGSFENQIKEYPNIIFKPFLSQEDLIKEINSSHCFILPSTYEPWGLVIHEFVSAGMPIITSNVCGANSLFLINNFNGFVFNEHNRSLKECMIQFMNLSVKEMEVMSKNSLQLSKRISPEISAASFISIL